VIRPESTAKTSLARQLAEHFGGVWVPEFAREYALAKGNLLTAGDVEVIARGQIDVEDRATRTSGLVVLDTDLISTVVYARHYYGSVPDWIVSEARRRRADLYLLMDIDVPWQSDPARDSGHNREELFEKFENALQELEANYERVGGTGEARLRRAIEIVLRLDG
jgi:NadR type nicotinamide-nucleotide adenylyltransferase